MFIPYLRILKKRNFFLLWFGQIISQFGDRLTQMALIGLVYRLQPGSALGLAKMFSLAVIPVFLISPVAGVYVDRWNKQKTLYTSDFLRGLLILLIPLFFFKLKAIIFVYLFVFLSFCTGRFFIPAKMAIIPSLVDKEDLFLANSLVSITAMIAAVLGLGFGAVIVERWGLRAAFIIDAYTFLISALLILFMRIREEARFNARDIIQLGKDAFLKVKISFLGEVKEGMAYLFRSKETRYASKVFFILFSSIGALYTVFIVFIQDIFSSVTLDIGRFAVGFGIGLFVGSLFYGRIGANLPVRKVINLSLSFASMYLIIFATTLRIYPLKMSAFFSCMFLGIVVSPIVIAVNTLIHKESEDNFWGRIFSSLEVVIHLGFILFMFVSSYLAEKMTPFTIIVSVSIIIILFSLPSLFKRNDYRRGA